MHLPEFTSIQWGVLNKETHPLYLYGILYFSKYLITCSFIMIEVVLFIVVQSLRRVWLCDPMNCSTPGFPVLYCFLESAQTHVLWVSDAIQPSHPLSSPFPLALSLSQHQGPCQWVFSLHWVTEVSELQLQHQSFQWIFRVDFLSDWLISSLSKGLSRVFSTTVWKHQFFGAQPSLWSNSHIWTWLL